MKIDKGSTIGVFSPSWVITNEAPEAAARAEEYIRSCGFNVKHGKLWGKADAYRSGSPKERADEFNTLLRDPEVDILMASVGGQVTNGMLPYIDYKYYTDNPKPVVGMSDVTSLLLAIYAKTGIPTYYGSNFVTSYARLGSYRDIALKSLCDVLNFENSYEYSFPEYYSDDVIEWSQELTKEKRIPNEIITLSGGKTKGRLIGGNLYTIGNIWGTPFMPEIRSGDILFIEDTEEWACGVERTLAQLKISGVFDMIGGLIIGKCRHFEHYGTEKTYYEFIYDYLDRLNYPVLAECDFSHCAPMLTIPIGISAVLDADAKTIELVR
ncbi:MAG: LD-carboxypeptidase [Ruminococcus sp.]|nr:LD-carboxypeptidase [Ruminococcus sp.]